jgi:pimeloyl-ACP methyl ester carboxylesterase
VVTEPTPSSAPGSGAGPGGAAATVPSSQGHDGSRFPTASDWERWGIDPAWSTWITVSGHRWHLLETRAAPASPGVLGADGGGSRTAARPDPGGAETGAVRVVCVHGNPTWGILWQPILRRLGDRFHVVAPDQLGMGWSQHTDFPRHYGQRVADLGELIDAIDERDGERPPILLVAHDWGGAIAMGWAVDHPDRVAGMVLTNTGIAVPAGTSGAGRHPARRESGRAGDGVPPDVDLRARHGLAVARAHPGLVP